jgi:hypothetical protein
MGTPEIPDQSGTSASGASLRIPYGRDVVPSLISWQRFPRGKQVGSYLELIPSEASSGKRQQQMGHITKQGNTLLRWLLVEAAVTAQRHDASWHRQYVRLSMAKHHGVAKVAIVHKLAVRLYWMLRSGQDYTQIVERGSHARQSGCPVGRKQGPIE